MIPLPFARVDVILDTPIIFSSVKADAEFEADRARLEAVLREGVDLDS